MMKSVSVVLLLSVSLAHANPFGANGSEIDPQKVKQLRIHETTRDKAVEILGNPDSVVKQLNGEMVFNYQWTETHVKPSSFIPIYGIFKGGAKVIRHSVIITFDTKGLVSDVFSTEK